MKAIIVIIIATTSLFSSAQLSESSNKTLRIELAKKVNSLRSSLGLQPLLTNEILKKAAVFHSEYMAKRKELTHKQNKTKYSSPKKRVELMKGGDFEIVGENVLFSKEQSFPLKKKELILLAGEMFEQWKNSPSHYANMIDPEYTFGDFGFKVATNNSIFATQVFGKKGVVVEGQLSPNSYGLTVASADCEKEFKQLSNIVLNMGNAIKIEGGEVYYYYHNINYFNKIFTSPNDGIAIDIVRRDQLKCGKPTQLDFSPIYDGILLKPVYRNAIINNNVAESDHRIITSLGVLPKELLDQEISASVVLIKNGKMCKYLIPTAVPSASYQLREIYPKLSFFDKTSFIDTGIIKVQELIYDFNTNRTRPIKKPLIKESDLAISSVKILSYSSIEGDSIHNVSLQEDRGETIRRHIMSETSTPDSIYQIIARENWQQMNYQFHYYKKEDLLKLSHDTIKAIASNNSSSLPWDSLLIEQRQSSAVIHYTGSIDTTYTHSTVLDINLRTAAIYNLPSLANKALFEIFHDTNFHTEILFEKDVWEFVKKESEVVANYAAVLSQEFSFDIQKSTKFLYNWMSRPNELSDDAKFNLLHLYTLLGKYFLDEWDVSTERLSNVVHPSKIKPLETKNIESPLVLNLHLTFIKYFGQINDGANISKSFYFISNHFKENSTTNEDDVDLALFFNNWSMYHMTKDLLVQRFKSQNINEDGVFILAKTLAFDSRGSDSDFYEEVQKKAIEMNTARWCAWVNKDFQILRNYKVKRLYCAKCNTF